MYLQTRSQLQYHKVRVGYILRISYTLVYNSQLTLGFVTPPELMEKVIYQLTIAVTVHILGYI